MLILLSQVYCVWQVVKTPTIISNNPAYWQQSIARVTTTLLWDLKVSRGVTMSDNVLWNATPCILTQRSRHLLEKLTLLQLFNQVSAFYGTRRFIPVFTTARHFSLSLARPIQTTPPSFFLNVHFNIILSSMPISSKWCTFFRFDV